MLRGGALHEAIVRDEQKQENGGRRKVPSDGKDVVESGNDEGARSEQCRELTLSMAAQPMFARRPPARRDSRCCE